MTELILAVIGAAVSAGVALFLGRHLNARANHQAGHAYLAFAVFAAIPIILLVTPLVRGTSFVVADKTYGVDVETILKGVQTIVQSAEQNVASPPETGPTSTSPVARSSIHSIQFSTLGSVELAGAGFGDQPGSVTLRVSGAAAPFTFSNSSIASWSDDQLRVRADAGDSTRLDQLFRNLARASKALERRVHVLEYSVNPVAGQAIGATQVTAMAFRLYGTAPICNPDRDSCSQMSDFSEVGDCADFKGMVECNNRCLTGAKIVCARLTRSEGSERS